MYHHIISYYIWFPYHLHSFEFQSLHFYKIYFRKPWFQGHSLVIRGILVILTSISNFQTLIFHIFTCIQSYHIILCLIYFHLIFKISFLQNIFLKNPDFKAIVLLSRGILVILTPISNFQSLFSYFQSNFISYVYIREVWIGFIFG